MCFERSVIASENNEGCIWLFCYAIIATWNLALPRVAARQLQLYYSVVRLSVETSQTFVRCAAVYWAVFELVTRYLIFRMFNKLGQVRSGQVAVWQWHLLVVCTLSLAVYSWRDVTRWLQQQTTSHLVLSISSFLTVTEWFTRRRHHQLNTRIFNARFIELAAWWQLWV